MVKEDSGKHLEFIINITARIERNSFLLKGWTVTLVMALIVALAAQNTKNILLYFFAILPAVAFWILDAFYHRQLYFYTQLYNDIRLKDEQTLEGEGSFSLDITPFFNKEIEKPKDKKSWFQRLKSWFKEVKFWFTFMNSTTLRIFYLAIIATAFLISLALYFA
jgi:hypothetical protein